jgi:predicted GIY-YIG superfamily endonuclease
MRRERAIKMMTRDRKRKLIGKTRAAPPGRRRRLKAPRSPEKA